VQRRVFEQMNPAKNRKVLLFVALLLALAGTFILKGPRARKDPRRDQPVSANRQDKAELPAPFTKAPSRADSFEVDHSKSPPGGVSVQEPELPEPFDAYELFRTAARAQMDLVFRAQDKVVSKWPAYLDVREQLSNEVFAELDVDNLSTSELVQAALELRKKFWQLGGTSSEAAYRYAYMARALLELAHSRSPEDMTITDELVETIQSTQFRWMCEADSGKPVRNTEFVKVLSELRLAQYDQIDSEVEQGRTPVWEDFVRALDLVYLLGGSADYESAQEVGEWIIREAPRGGWIHYMAPLKQLQRNLSEGKVLEFNIYLAEKTPFPEQFKYARRLPSFKGPDPEKRGVIAVHTRALYRSWQSDEEIHEEFNRRSQGQ
jgi:hypothetical protein